MENKFLKAAVFAMMLGVAGSAMAQNYNAPTGGNNKLNTESTNQTVVGTDNHVNGENASAYGNQNYAIGKNTTAIGNYARTDSLTGTKEGEAVAEGATAVGSYVSAYGNYSVALGAGKSGDKEERTTASGARAIAVGYMTKAAASGATALGSEASAGAVDSIAIGTEATTGSNATYGIALGQGSDVEKTNAIAFGTSSYVNSDNAMAFGYGSRIADKSSDAVAIGTNSYVKVANAVAIGKDSAVSAYEKNPTDRVVSFGHTEDDTYYNAETKEEIAYGNALTSRLINVTAGKLDTDAVNFSQIKTTARTGNELKNGTYIQSTYTGTGAKQSLVDGVTIGTNLEALDAKAAAQGLTVTLAATARDTSATYKGNNNQIVANDGTVLATFQKGTLEEGTSLTATDFVTNGDVYAAIAARAQKITLNTALDERDKVNNKAVAGNALVSNDGEVLATFESEKPSSLDGKKFVTSGDVFAADVKTGQTVSLDPSEGTEKITNQDNKEVSLKKNTIYSNNGDALVTFQTSKPGAESTEAERLAATDFVTNGAVYSDDVKSGQEVTLDAKTTHDVNGKKIQSNQIATNDGTVLATFTSEKPATLTGTAFVTSGDVFSADTQATQTITLDSKTTHDVNGKKIQSNQIATNDGTVLATFTSEKPASLTGTAFVTSGDVFSADTKATQTITLATTKREVVNGKEIKNNEIATNDGTVLATFTSEKPATLDGTAFVTSGNVFAADVKENQSISLSTETTTVNGKTIQKKQIATNEGKVLATFEDATYELNNKGFVSGGLLWSESIKAGQKPSFAANNNVIKNNDNDVLVTFDEGVVAVASGAKGAKNTDVNFVSARNAYANDVAYAQDLTLNIANNYTADIYTNAGAKVGTLKIEGGEIAKDNTGFVTGDQVWKAIAKYNQVIDFSKKDTTTTDTDSTTPGTDTTDTDADSGKTDTDQDSTKTDSGTDSPTTNGNIVMNDEMGSETGSGSEGGDTEGGTTEGGTTEGGTTEGGTTEGGTTEGGTTGGDQGGDSGDQGTGDADKPTTQVLNNKIYANDGTVIAELRQGEVANEDTGFVSGGQVYAEDVKNGQKIDATNLVIKNNAENKALVTFTKGEVKADNQGFVSGDQVNTVKTELSNADVKSGQKIDATTNVIMNNKNETLVTFTKGEVAKDNAGFVSGGQAYAADIAKNQTIDATNRDIKNNDGKTLVSFTKGAVTEGNQGFVSGDQVNTVKTEINKNIETVKTDLNNQITDVNTRVDQTNQNLTNLGGQVNEVEERVNKVGAGAAALAALHPMDYDPNAKLTFAVGYGNYRSTSAGAIGAFIRPNNRVMWSLGATMGNGENMYNTGLSFAIGSGKGLRMSRAELDYKVGNLSDQLTQMQTEHQTFARDNAQQDAAILDLHARLKRVEEILAQLTAK